MTKLPPEATGKNSQLLIEKQLKNSAQRLGVPARRFVDELTAHSRLNLGPPTARRPYLLLLRLVLPHHGATAPIVPPKVAHARHMASDLRGAAAPIQRNGAFARLGNSANHAEVALAVFDPAETSERAADVGAVADIIEEAGQQKKERQSDDNDAKPHGLHANWNDKE